MKNTRNPLRPGDVIRTHPQRGFWGCAVVLTARDRTTEFLPQSHLAITVLRRNRKYAWAKVMASELEIVRLTPTIRVGPYDYRRARRPRTAIGIYAVKPTAVLDVVGRVDPSTVYARPLTFDVGDGTSGAYPLCGPITERLGWEAIVAWRELHEPEAFERDRRRSMGRFERYEERRLAEARAKRRRNRKA